MQSRRRAAVVTVPVADQKETIHSLRFLRYLAKKRKDKNKKTRTQENRRRRKKKKKKKKHLHDDDESTSRAQQSGSISAAPNKDEIERYTKGIVPCATHSSGDDEKQKTKYIREYKIPKERERDDGS